MLDQAGIGTRDRGLRLGLQRIERTEHRPIRQYGGAVLYDPEFFEWAGMAAAAPAGFGGRSPR